MRNKVLMTILMLVAMTAAACGGQAAAPNPTAPAAPTKPPAQPPASPAGSDALAGTSWQLATLNGKPALKDAMVTLNFENGQVTGSDGCNSYNAKYTATDTTLKINGPIAATMMACADPIMTQSTAYTQALEQTATYKVSGGQLTLYDASGKELATFTTQSSDLSGTSWIVTGYNNGKQAVVSVQANTELTANFGADGKLSGNAGCNDYTASYETNGQNIKIGPAAVTSKACEPAVVMDQETQYLAALSTVATYRVDGNKLELRTADGALAASFQKAATGLADTSWNATGYNNGKQAVVSLMANTTITANFGADGTLAGNAGCNDYSASYQTDGIKITIGPAVTTRKACETAVMDQETQYLAALGTAARYRIDGSKMELRTADGALAATYQKAP